MEGAGDGLGERAGGVAKAGGPGAASCPSIGRNRGEGRKAQLVQSVSAGPPIVVPEIRDDRAGGRFVLEEDGETAELVYDIEPGRMFILHTGVPSAISRRGIGSRLVEAAVGRARQDGLTLVPWCPFARRWVVRHEELVAGVDVDWTAMPPSSR